MQRIAITGATGDIGGRLIPRLLECGYSIRCLVRTPAKLAGRSWAGLPEVEIVTTDLGDADSIATGLAGCSAPERVKANPRSNHSTLRGR